MTGAIDSIRTAVGRVESSGSTALCADAAGAGAAACPWPRAAVADDTRMAAVNIAARRVRTVARTLLKLHEATRSPNSCTHSVGCYATAARIICELLPHVFRKLGNFLIATAVHRVETPKNAQLSMKARWRSEIRPRTASVLLPQLVESLACLENRRMTR
jgi:hypothetical protein